MQNAKVNGFVVGISGGVDSAVTSTLCTNRNGCFMCRNANTTSASHVNRAKEHIAQLKETF
jgi:NAD+ synthase